MEITTDLVRYLEALGRIELSPEDEAGMQKGLSRLAEANVENTSLTDFDTVAAIAASEGYIQDSDVARLIAFRNNPSDESWITGGKA